MEAVKPKRPRRYLRSRKTKRLILENATEILVAEGYKKTTVEKIKERTGLGYGTIFSHYKGKDDILSSIVDNIFQAFFEDLNEHDAVNDKESLVVSYREVAQGLLRLAIEHKPIFKVYQDAKINSDKISSHWDSIVSDLTDNLRDSITTHQSNKVMREFDASEGAKVFSLLLLSAFWEVVNEKEEDIEGITNTTVDIIIRGTAN